MLLAFTLVLAQSPLVPFSPEGPIISNPATFARSTAESFQFFEFAPTSGAGMGAACACTNPTGAKGETLTFTRASSATCTATATGGLATTGIANGDLVTCSTNQARVEYDSAGVKGLLVEGARTNSAVRSQEFNTSGVWNAEAAGSGSVPTITADQGVAPDGTTTADRAQFSACASGSDSDIYQSTGVANAVSSVYVKGYGGTSGSISVCKYSLGASACTACAYDGTTWTRCSHTVTGASATNMVIGCVNAQVYYPGGTDTGAADVLLWGAQHEAGTFVSSYIPTTSAAVTRAVDAPSFSVAWNSTTYSQAGTINTERTTVTNERVVTLKWGAALFTDDYFPSAWQAFFYDGASKTTNSASGLATSVRVGSFYDLTNLGASRNSVETTSARTITITGTPVTVRIGVDGSGGTTGHANGIISKVCLSPTATACR